MALNLENTHNFASNVQPVNTFRLKKKKKKKKKKTIGKKMILVLFLASIN